jgi:hypothetical protein
MVIIGYPQVGQKVTSSGSEPDLGSCSFSIYTQFIPVWTFAFVANHGVRLV